MGMCELQEEKVSGWDSHSSETDHTDFPLRRLWILIF